MQKQYIISNSLFDYEKHYVNVDRGGKMGNQDSWRDMRLMESKARQWVRNPDLAD
jgi:hypothetical protein